MQGRNANGEVSDIRSACHLSGNGYFMITKSISSWEPVRSSRASRNFFSNTASPFYARRTPTSLLGINNPTPMQSYNSEILLCSFRATVLSSLDQRSHFYGKLAVTFEISVGVEEEIAYTAHWSPSVPFFSSHRVPQKPNQLHERKQNRDPKFRSKEATSSA